ncbi:MAG: hypothetical protein WEA09_11690 [Gemmatimonadota bacterium]
MKHGSGSMLVVLAVLGGVAAGATPLSAQSILNSRGLGLPVAAMDGRAAALGGVGVALSGGELLVSDPASAGVLLLPTLVLVSQPGNLSFSLGEETGSGSANRFPLLGVAYPVRGSGMLTFTLGSFLDQRWRTSLEREVNLGSGAVPVVDTFESDGGVARVQFGYVHRLGGGVTAGVTAGAHSGEWNRTFTRQFDTLSVGRDVEDFLEEGHWRVTGPTGSAGLSWSPGSSFRVAGSATWSGRLTATPDAVTEGDTVSYGLPWEFRVGASGALTPDLTLNIGMHRAAWDGDGFGVDEQVRATTTVGGGLEFTGSSFWGRSLPIRLGYRQSQLPFQFEGEFPSERIFSGGVGWLLASVESIPLARFDLALERGRREAGSLTERFLRTTISIRVSGG